MFKVIFAIALVLLTIYLVPFLVYSLFTIITDLKPPEETSPAQFLISIFVSKIGTAVTFVLIFFFASAVFSERWLLYALLWWVMFVLGEIGQALGPNYSWKEALAGIVSETIYWPMAASLTYWLIGT
ncbi:MAG: hypothetical protein QNJ45_28500 [Ardenticatenaceae bacterium]|nr:hypothetical protein [Ardenticatenaceae bacterium]